MKKRKWSTHDSDFWDFIANKQLEPYQVQMDEIREMNFKIDNISWYQYFTTTKKEEEEFKKWGIKQLMNTKEKLSKVFAESEMKWYILSYGLSYKK